MSNTKKIEEYITDNKNAYFTNNNEIFMAIAAFSIIIAFFSRISITLGTAVGLIIAYYVFNFLMNASKNHEQKKIELKKNKIKYIRPAPENLENYDEIIDFLYSIQDFYYDNPPAYEEMVQNIQSFFEVYEESVKIDDYVFQNYTVAELKMRDAVNALHSIIINCRNAEKFKSRVNRSIRVLYGLLNNYMEKMELQVKKRIQRNGYNRKTILIPDKKVKPYNIVDSKTFMYQII